MMIDAGALIDAGASQRRSPSQIIPAPRPAAKVEVLPRDTGEAANRGRQRDIFRPATVRILHEIPYANATAIHSYASVQQLSVASGSWPLVDVYA